jgi:hypothetical protein
VETPQAELLEPDAGAQRAWHCSIHGKVTKCPFVWMNCDYNADWTDIGAGQATDSPTVADETNGE